MVGLGLLFSVLILLHQALVPFDVEIMPENLLKYGGLVGGFFLFFFLVNLLETLGLGWLELVGFSFLVSMRELICFVVLRAGTKTSF